MDRVYTQRIAGGTTEDYKTMERVTFRIPEQQIETLEQMVENGDYPTKSEAVRSSVRELTREYKRRQAELETAAEMETD